MLADGSFVTASATENADLFWAVRGGGGNFGVVTSFLFRRHPVSDRLAGPMLWPLETAAEVMRWYRDFIAERAGGAQRLLRVPDRAARAAVPGGAAHAEGVRRRLVLHGGPERRRRGRSRRSGAFGPPLLDGVQPMPFPAMQSAFDALYSPGHAVVLEGRLRQRAADEAIAAHVEHGSALPTLQSTMHLYPIDGAVHRVGEDETAFSYRDARWSQVIVGVDPDPANRRHDTDVGKGLLGRDCTPTPRAAPT